MSEEVIELPCAGCGEPVKVTRTSSLNGHVVYHGLCYERKS